MRIFKTYVGGLDEKLDGGVPRGHVVLISGSPGTMKSSLAYSIIHSNARHGNVRGIYISLEQSRRSLAFQMERLGLCGQEENVAITDLARIRKAAPSTTEQPWIEVIQRHVEFLSKSNKYSMLVLDSLPVLDVLSRVESRRNQLFYLFEWLRDLEMTSFIISEIMPDSRELHDEEFLADGIVYLSLEKVGAADIQRRIRIVKMRGMAHNTSVFNLEFRNQSFLITPPL